MSLTFENIATETVLQKLSFVTYVDKVFTNPTLDSDEG
jgi:hypothetical protein